MSASRARILIVDDDEALCDLIELWLQARHDVTKAHDGEQALAAMSTGRPDVAVVDLMMPRMSGIELAGKMRSSPDLRDVPIIFVSAYHAILEPHEREAIKPWGLLSKPFHREMLEKRIDEILRALSEEPEGS